jgi:hypothetical protein
MPRALTPGNLAACHVEGQRGRVEVVGGPGPLCLQQPQQVPEVFRCVGRASGQPPDHFLQFRKQTGTLISRTGSGVRGQGKVPQQAGQRGRVVAWDQNQRLHHGGGAEEGADVIAVDLRAQIDSVAYPMATSADLEETVNFAEILDVASLPSRPTSAPSKRSKPL